MSEIPIYKAASITAHGACYKCDLNTIFLGEMRSKCSIWLITEDLAMQYFGYAVFFGLKLYDTVDFIAGLIRDEEILSGLLTLETGPLNVICYAFV